MVLPHSMTMDLEVYRVYYWVWPRAKRPRSYPTSCPGEPADAFILKSCGVLAARLRYLTISLENKVLNLAAFGDGDGKDIAVIGFCHRVWL